MGKLPMRSCSSRTIELESLRYRHTNLADMEVDYHTSCRTRRTSEELDCKLAVVMASRRLAPTRTTRNHRTSCRSSEPGMRLGLGTKLEQRTRLALGMVVELGRMVVERRTSH